jgi:hypothetical protein
MLESIRRYDFMREAIKQKKEKKKDKKKEKEK